jgi:hypothetical protein
MSAGDEHRRGRGAGESKKWIGLAAAVSATLAAVITAVMVPAGTPVVQAPMAAARTATPWVPRPIFGPRPAPQPGSAIGQTQKPRPAGADEPDWGTRANPSFQAIQAALAGLSNALDASDLNGVQAACQQMGTAGARFAATLPAPRQQMTEAARAAVAEINAMSDACLADSPDIDAVMSHATAANNHLVAVAEMPAS